ncbi:protein kinase [Streptomyces sp. NPDC029216]|uniref:protein kinase domain-containing protein n=1 Tax=Streptomyces sp. NPDC029216 TaxID=3154701 RepID=UPI0033F5BEB9
MRLGTRAGHPRLVRLLDCLVLDVPEHPSLDGAVVLVMERASGSLRDLIGAGVTRDEGGRLIEGICEGLAHLHRSGWVHADLKPENVLIGADGAVRLSDFGPATELAGTHGYALPMGTLDYLPPERWRAPLGELGVQVRPSADIWALGLMVHEVFGPGAPLFPGATPMARGAAVQEYAAGRAPADGRRGSGVLAGAGRRLSGPVARGARRAHGGGSAAADRRRAGGAPGSQVRAPSGVRPAAAAPGRASRGRRLRGGGRGPVVLGGRGGGGGPAGRVA